MGRICASDCAYYDGEHHFFLMDEFRTSEMLGLVYLKRAIIAQIRHLSMLSKRAYNAFTLVYLTAHHFNSTKVVPLDCSMKFVGRY